MNLKQILAEYKLAPRHNPKQFYPNSFEIEMVERKLVLVGVAKKHIRKKFRIVGILRPRR